MPRYEHDCSRCTFLGEWREYDLYFCLDRGTRPTVIARHGEDGEYLSGIEFGEMAFVYPLAKALALAKEKGLYLDKKEKILLPEAEKPLYIVIGYTGQWDDARQWPVRAFRDRGTAETYANACMRKADVWFQRNKDTGPPHYWSALDPNMDVEDKFYYKVLEVPIALRAEEIDTSWEICPICRGQMYDTPDGRICENGHEGL
jgi:hypothetical protein